MPRRRKGTPPPYLHHRASGQAYSTLNGKPVYHGVHGSPESRAAYQAFLARWEEAQGRVTFRAAPGCTVEELVAAFLGYAEGHYRRADGTNTHELGDFRRNLGHLVQLHGGLPVASYRARQLRDLRQVWVDAGLARTTVNQQVGRVRRLFRWGHGEGELVPPEVLTSLAALPDLPEGAAGEVTVPPAPQEAVFGVLPHLSRQLQAMLQLQWHCGARPGEVCALRGREVHRDGRARLGQHTVRVATGWVWQPEQHKNRRRGKFLAYVLGPQARAVLGPWLRADPDEYVFQPREAEAERLRALSRAVRFSTNPCHAPGLRYHESSYYHAVARACTRAGVEPFSPNQVRHSFLSRVEAEYDLEDARKTVGHASVNTTLLYVERDIKRAAEIVEQLG